MIETLFYFIVFIIIGLAVAGFSMRNAGCLVVAGVIAIMIGALFLSGEVFELQKPLSFGAQDINSDYLVTTVSYTTLTSASSSLVLMLQYIFFLGGFVLLLYALFITLRGPPPEQTIEETLVE